MKAFALFHEIRAMLETPHAKLLIDLGHSYPDVSSKCHVLFLDFKSLTHVNQEFLNAQKDLLPSLSTGKKAWLKGEMSEPESWFYAKADDMHKLIDFYTSNIERNKRVLDKLQLLPLWSSRTSGALKAVVSPRQAWPVSDL